MQAGGERYGLCRFTLRIPDNVPLEKAGPLMCAGITTFSPMMHFGMNEPGKKLGVVGLGGEAALSLSLRCREEKRVVGSGEGGSCGRISLSGVNVTGWKGHYRTDF